MGARLVLDSHPDASWEFDQGRIVLGRALGCDVVLPDASVSHRHASIEVEGLRYTVLDHGSTNGTRVEGTPIVPGRRKVLRDGDRIGLGRFALRFHANVPVSGTQPRERTASLAKELLRQRATTTPRRIVVLAGVDEGAVFELPPGPAELRIGRSLEAGIQLRDAELSREHATLRVTADHVELLDGGSKNGSLVRGRRVATAVLTPGDELELGHTRLRFEDDAADLRAAEALPDEPYQAPEPPLEPIPEAPLEAPLLELEPGPSASSSASPARGATAEWLILGLALVVFVASAVGLAWLAG